MIAPKLFEVTLVVFTIVFVALGYNFLKQAKGFWLVLLLHTVGNHHSHITTALGINNILAMKIYTIIELALMSMLYSGLLDGLLSRKAVLILSGCVMGVYVYHILFVTDLLSYNSIARATAYLLYITFTIMYFMKHSLASGVNVGQPQIVVNSALLFIYASGFFYILLYQTFIELKQAYAASYDKALFNMVYSIYLTLLSLAYLYIAAAMYRYQPSA